MPSINVNLVPWTRFSVVSNKKCISINGMATYKGKDMSYDNASLNISYKPFLFRLKCKIKNTN